MDPFVAEIRIFPFNFAPKGWAWCDGQILPLSQNTAIFSLLSNTYGGNGTSNFALPDLRGRIPMHPGQGVGLSQHTLGETGGTETVTLLESQIPNHTHQTKISSVDAVTNELAGNSMAKATEAVYSSSNPNTQMSENTLSPTGGGQAHNNMMPYITYYFNIALQGVYPPRP